MRKKALVYLLAAALTAGSLPVTALAEGFEAEGGSQEALEVSFESELVEESFEDEGIEAFTEELLQAEETEAEETVEAEDSEEGQEAVETETGVLTASGTCGGTTYTLDSTGTMRISGKGATDSYGFSGASDLFQYKDEVKHLIVEEGVTGIGGYVFEGFSQMTDVELPDSLKSVGNCAFGSCWSLQSITIPKNVKTIGYEAFAYSKISTVTISDQVTDLIISRRAFASGNVEKVYLSAGVKEIGEGAFERNDALTEVTIRPGVKSMGSGAFADCHSLQSLVLPGTLTEVGSSLCSGCTGLKSVTISEGITEVGRHMFWGCTSLSSVSLPGTLKEISENMFAGCSSLQKLVIPEGVESIGYSLNGAFVGCTSLREVSIPSTMSSIGHNAFYECKALKNLKLNEGLVWIDSQAFYGCTNLMDQDLPSTVEYVGASAFWGCSQLTEINIPEGMEKISGYAFKDCASLRVVRIPGSVTEIGDQAFYGDTSLDEIYFEGDAPSISSSAFGNVVATAYYPSTANGWTAEKRQDYGGHLTWKSYTPALRTPGLVSISNSSTGLKVTWSKVSGASGYVVFRINSSGTLTYVGRTTGTSYNNTTAKAGTSYTYTVRAYRGSFSTANANRFSSKYWSDYNSTGLTAVRLTQGKLSSLTNAAASINLKWNKVTGAKGYYIYCKVGSGSYKRIATVGSGTLSYSYKDFANGTKYTFAVRAYNGSSVSSYQGKVIYRLSRSQLSKAAKSGSGKIALQWGKNVRVTGYQIAYTVGGTTKYKTVTGSANVKTTLTGLKAGQTYTVKVRGYKTVSGTKYYSGWSTAKTVKA